MQKYQYWCFQAQSMTLLFTNPEFQNKSLNSLLIQTQSGSSSNQRVLTQLKYLQNSSNNQFYQIPGNSSHKLCADIDAFFYFIVIQRYYSDSSSLRLSQGRLPFKKHTIRYPKDSRSSRLEVSYFVKINITFSNVAMNAPESDVIFGWVVLLSNELVIILLVNEFSAVAKVNNKDFISLFSQSNQKILRINVIVNKVFGVNPLNPIYQLIQNKERGFKCKLSITVVEQMIQRRPINIRNQRTIMMLNPKPIEIGYSSSPLDQSIDFGLFLQLACIVTLDIGLKFNSDFLFISQVNSFVDLRLLGHPNTVNCAVFAVECKLQFFHCLISTLYYNTVYQSINFLHSCQILLKPFASFIKIEKCLILMFPKILLHIMKVFLNKILFPKFEEVSVFQLKKINLHEKSIFQSRPCESKNQPSQNAFTYFRKVVQKTASLQAQATSQQLTQQHNRSYLTKMIFFHEINLNSKQSTTTNQSNASGSCTKSSDKINITHENHLLNGCIANTVVQAQILEWFKQKGIICGHPQDLIDEQKEKQRNITKHRQMTIIGKQNQTIPPPLSDLHTRRKLLSRLSLQC